MFSKYKTYLFVFLSGISIVLFQNCQGQFSADVIATEISSLEEGEGNVQAASQQKQFFHVDHSQVAVEPISSTKYDLIDYKNRRQHEVKMEGDTLLPKVFHYSRFNDKFLWFESSGSGKYTKDRSEIRLRNVLQEFNTYYYTSFKLYYPSWAASIDLNNFNIIWQCPQIGASKPYIPYNTSPPLSLQIKKDKLVLSTIQNYKLRDPKNNFEDKQFNVAPLPRNRWVKVMMAFRMGKNGKAVVYVDGKQVFSTTGPIGYHNAYSPFSGKQECSIRYGIYKSGRHLGRYAILFDDVKVGTNYDDVRP